MTGSAGFQGGKIAALDCWQRGLDPVDRPVPPGNGEKLTDHILGEPPADQFRRVAANDAVGRPSPVTTEPAATIEPAPIVAPGITRLP